MKLRTVYLALLAVGLATVPLQAQFRPIQVRDADNAARQPFAYVTDMSTHGFAVSGFTVDPHKVLVIEETDAHSTNITSAGGVFDISVVTNGIKLDHYTLAAGLANLGFTPLFHQQARYYADPGSTVTITQAGVYGDTVKFQISGYQVNLP